MTTTKLVIGNKNYSSWSLRGWLALKQSGIAFEEAFINLGDIDYKKQLRKQSTSAKVPVLLHDGFEIWDTLAIIEYLAELRPDAGFWPSDLRARTRARSISAEMHSSFSALRGAMPMNIRRSLKGKGRASGVDMDILRISEIWRDCLERVDGEGDFLFGSWTAADAMFAPVASRFRTYGVELDGTCQRYTDAILASAWFKEWEADALNEPYIVPDDEIDMD
ncbi:MAG: glutathione S-transferase family protein [Alphaproteobacteria bacterium]